MLLPLYIYSVLEANSVRNITIRLRCTESDYLPLQLLKFLRDLLRQYTAETQMRLCRQTANVIDYTSKVN
jgi:hypothetical protein